MHSNTRKNYKKVKNISKIIRNKRSINVNETNFIVNNNLVNYLNKPHSIIINSLYHLIVINY